MHDYAIFDHSRTNIGRWLGIISYAIAGLISGLLAWFYTFTGLQSATYFAVSSGAIYFVLHAVFNHSFWKLKLIKLPDISGVWTIEGTTLREDGEIKYEWPAELDVEQTWEKISITLKTSKSDSKSYIASLTRLNGSKGGWLLSYSYRNNPNIDHSHELNSHKGFCEITFNDELTQGTASYFNSNGRRTFGKMELKRVANDKF